MPLEQSNAIVIRSVEFSESSLILDLYTRDFGKISGIAKGAKRLKNPFESALDLLTQISVSFIRKNSEALDLLTEAKLIHRFRPRPGNLMGLNAGYYLAELLRLMTEEGDPSPPLYDLATQTLNRMEEGDHLPEYLFHFEWSLLELSGQRPSTDLCVHCGREVNMDQERQGKRRISFGFQDGGVICHECRERSSFQLVATFDPDAIDWLNRLDPSEPPPFFSTESIPVRKEIQGLIHYYFNVLTGKKPRLQETVERGLIPSSLPKKGTSSL